jgi:hypothetical protein
MLISSLNQISQAANPIRITVKVSELFNSHYPPSDDCSVNDYTKIEDKGNSAGYGQPKDNFVTDVKKGGALIWKIEYEDNTERKDYDLELVCIAEKKTSPCEFFDFDPLLPDHKSVLATPKHGNLGDINNYNIIFIIEDKFRNSKTFVIDPKLRMT